MMKQQDLIDLGFEKVNVSSKESGSKPYFYYTYYFSNGFCLITRASDEIVNGKWSVEVFDTDESFEFKKVSELSSLITILENARVQDSK